MIFEFQTRKQYPSDSITDDTKRLETQIRVYKRWLNSLLKQANAREITDVLDIFRDTKNFYYLCKHLFGQKVISTKEPTSEDASYLDRALAMLERLYGHEIASAMQAAIIEITSKKAWNSEAQLRDTGADPNRAVYHNLLLLGLDTIWIFIVTVRAGTGPPSNLVGSISSSGSTITRRSLSGAHSSSQSHSVNLTSTRTPCVDRWLITQDERLMAWCVAVTEGYSGLNICNFMHSWRDGLAFLALTHQSRPDLFNYPTRLEKTANQNLSLAFHLATAEFACPRLLEPIDMHPDQVDARATATYVMELRRAIERDRKRRSRGILEIQTAAMVQDQSGASPEAVNVTVLSQSSPTSTASTSDVAWLDEEFEDDSGEDGQVHGTSLLDPDLFDSMIETTLAWLLAMEEQFANNDITKSDGITVSLLDQQPWDWMNYCKKAVDLHRILNQPTPQLTAEERHEIESLFSLGPERLKKLHMKILGRVDEAMKHFEIHEDLTAHLSRRQMGVGRCLRLGNRLVQACRDRTQLRDPPADPSAQTLNETDREELTRMRERLLTVDPDVIQRQTALLSTRWNNLCRVNQAMGRRITNCLIRRQGMLLLAIRIHLEKLEAEQARQAELPFGHSIVELKNQLEVNRNLEEGIEVGEVLAERLDNFIVLVPQKSIEKEDGTDKETGLETVIAELASRWGKLVEWVNTRYAKLQNALLHWRHFEEEASVLSDWLAERAEEVSRVSQRAIETARRTRPNNVSEQISYNQEPPSPITPVAKTGSLNRNSEELDRVSVSGDENVGFLKIQSILDVNEAEMEAIENCINTHEPRWAQLLASLDRRAQAVRDACGDTEEVSRLVEATVDQLVSQWSQLVEPQQSVDDWMDRYSKDVIDGPDTAKSMEIENTASKERSLVRLDEEPFELPVQSSEKSQTKPTKLTTDESSTRSDQKRSADEHLVVPRTSKQSCLDGPPPSPTGYRAEFETKAEELLNWLENSAETLELITMDKHRALEVAGQANAVGRKVPASSGINTDNPVEVIESISKEVVEWRETMKRVLTMGERYREELLEVGENIEELDQLFDEVEERWSYLDSLLTEAARQVRVATNSQQFHQEIAKLLKLSNDPIEQEPDSEVIQSVQANQMSKVPPDQLESSENWAQQLNCQLEKLENQLSRAEEVADEPMTFNNPDDLEDRLLNVKNILKDLVDEHLRLTRLTVNHTDKADGQFDDLRRHASVVKQRLDLIGTKLKERAGQLQEVNEQMDFFMNQLEGIEKWLTDMRDYLDSVSQAVLSSVAVIQAQLQESCEALKDMDTLEPTLHKVTEVGNQLVVHFEQDYKTMLTNRLDALRQHWDQVRELTKCNRDQLKERLTEKDDQDSQSNQLTNLDSTTQSISRRSRSSSLPDVSMIQPTNEAQPTIENEVCLTVSTPAPTTVRVDIAELEIWMTDAKTKLAQYAVVENQSDLDSLQETCKILTSEIADRRYILAALDTRLAVDLMDQPFSDTQSLLTRAHFADLESALAAERERLRAALYHLEDFNTVLSGEQRWLEAISNITERIQTGEYMDSGELSDDLESLSRLAEEHTTEDEKRLESLAYSLIGAHILSVKIQQKFQTYKENFRTAQNEISRSQTNARNILHQIQLAESRTDKLVNCLKAMEPMLCERTNIDLLKNDEPALFAEWTKQLDEAESYLAQLVEQNKQIQMSTDRSSLLLNQKLQTCETQLQERLTSVRQLWSRLTQSSSIESQFTKIRHELADIENQTYLLDIVSTNSNDIQTSLEKTKDLLTSLNAIKVDIDYVQKTGQTLAERKPIDSPGSIAADLSSLQERHRKTVMIVLVALERLENALPLAQKLNALLIELNEKVASVEEVNDYLETADCPVSRKDMLQRVCASLQKLFDKNGIIEDVRQTAAKLKPLTIADKSKTTAQYFTEIEERINLVVDTRDAFNDQLEQVELGPRQFIKERSQSPQKSTTETPVLLGVKPSVNQLIDLLLNPDTPVSDTVRELAREIRDHFKSVVLFNRYCLGTNAPLPGMESDTPSIRSHLLRAQDYETTISERKAIVKYFRQQRTHLGDRLRELIVNAGGDGTINRLQDLLNLQTVWHETNEKLDRRGEHMALLEQQLTASEQAISDYMKNPNENQRAKCVNLIKRLEETYGWKLSADHERLKRATMTNHAAAGTVGGWIFDEDLLGKYEFTLQTVARYLNEVQSNLDLCNNGQLQGLASLLGRIESRFIDCYQLLSNAAEILNLLTKSNGEESKEANITKSNELNTEELLWLKVVLDTQKNRLDTYCAEFREKRSLWKLSAEHWETFGSQLKNVKGLISDLKQLEENLGVNRQAEMQEKLKYTCGRFKSLKNIALELLQTDLTSHRESNGVASEVPLQKANATASSDSVPPVVPPRRNSLHRGQSMTPAEQDRCMVQRELNMVHAQLQEMCTRYQCSELTDRSATSELMWTERSEDMQGNSTSNRRRTPRSTYVNADWLDEEVPPLSLIPFETLGANQSEVEACLNGLDEETRWLIESSGLVPNSLLNRKSDDILLSTTSRTKPTTAAELKLDLNFWHDHSSGSIEHSVEFTPSWLKSKWAKLESLIELTFEHEKQANTWCRKSSHLVRRLRETERGRTNATSAKVITRLESSCNRVSEALALAQAALKRRKACLTRWQSDLVELDTLLAEIKTLMGSYETCGIKVHGDTPGEWLNDLLRKLTEPNEESELVAPQNQWLAELRPETNGLGKCLETLMHSWTRVNEELSSPEQSSQMVRVPDHIASQIQTLLREWERLCLRLKLSTTFTAGGQHDSESMQAPTSATVICAPKTWSPNNTFIDVQSLPRNTTSEDVISANVAQTMSPTVARIRHEIDQLSRWLTAVTEFAVHSRVKLGDKFDQDTVNRQLLHVKLATSGGSRTDISQLYHPAALQLKMQQFLTELEARKPQLDRISVEKDRMTTWDNEEVLNVEFTTQAENLPVLWEAAEKHMTKRATELENIITETQKLQELQREVDRWMTKAEGTLDGLGCFKHSNGDLTLESPRRLPISPDMNRKRLQELQQSLPEGREKLTVYRQESELLMSRFRSEDTSKLQADLDRMTDRWNGLNVRLQQASRLLHSEPSYDDLAEPEIERPGLSQNHRTPSFERPSSATKDKLPERLEAVEKKVNRIVQLESELQHQCLLNDAPRATVSDQRAQMLVELQALQAEINTLSSLISVSVKPSNPDLTNLPDNEFLGRWRQLRDRVATLRQNMQTSPSHSSLFLARLKQFNNWVAHQDAAFRATVCPLTGNLLFILNLRDMVLTLMKENEAHRAQIEDALQQGRLHYGDGDDDEERADANMTGDSEFDSDGSELGQRPVGTRTDSSPGRDEQSRRVVRRIRRYLYHLKKRWFNLNASMFEYRQKLESVSERLSNFQSLFNDAVDQVRNAHAVTLRWMPVDCLPIERLGTELEQAQSFYEASEPLVVLLNNLDRQIAQFHESRVTIDPTVLTQQAALRNDFEHIRLQTETRIRTIDQALASTQLMERAQPSQAQPLLATLPPQTAPIRHPSHRLSNVVGQFSRPELVETNRSSNQPSLQLQTQSPSTPQQRQQQQTPVPLMDSVSPPWERCVHPSGTQVPYYKNHSTQDTHWDHPILYELLQSMKQLNEVRFAEYRTALKLRKLQKTLCLDALSISILAENLKHIGHSQPLEGPNMDPFDRMINVPQMIDCLIQLFNRSNAIYGQGSRSGQGDCRNGLDVSDSSKTLQKCSTLPPGTKPLNPLQHNKVDDFHHQRTSPIKCGKGFRRHSSTTRVSHMLAESGDLNARRRLPTPSKSGVTNSPSLSFGNRSSSLPESVAITATSPVHQSTSSRGRRSSTKAKRRFLIGPAKHPVNVCVDLTLNWLLNVYDRMRQGHIRALSFKVALTILAVANLDEKYRYLFSLIADSNGCVTEQRLSALLYECTLIPQNLGEGGWIGKEDFTTTVKLCFSQVQEIARSSEAYEGGSPYRVGQSIPVRHFLTWLRFGPTALMWLPLLHRVMLAEQVVHNVRCGVCQRQPISGLRYRCLRCLNFDLCQQCFFSGRTARNHKLTHPMQEYCTNSTSGDSFRDFTRIVRNRFRSRERSQRSEQTVVSGHGLQSTPGGTSLSRGRTRCCDTSSFGEELSKPRPAPVFGSDSTSMLPRDVITSEVTVCDSPNSSNALHSQTQSPIITDTPISRPVSTQIFLSSPDHRLPPRAASDTRHMNTELNYVGRSNDRDVCYPENNSTVARQPLVDEEHQLIAQYSRELRQQSEPQLNPLQKMVSSIHSSIAPPGMDRSTISDGFPVISTTGFNITDSVPPRTGYMSLDRRQVNRAPGYTACNGQPSSIGIHALPTGFSSAYSSGRLDPQSIAYRTPVQPYPYPLTTSSPMNRFGSYDSYGPTNIQRSYSLRARSQPPPDLHMNALRPIPGSGGGVIDNNRSPWFTGTQPPLPSFLSPADQTIRSLEEERKALQLEYERLRQRAHTPTYNNHVSTTSRQMQAQQQNQQRMARMQLQQHQMMLQQHQDAMRANVARGYAPRMSMQRPPSAGPPVPSGPSFSRLNSYSGSLGRATSATNGFSYPTDLYGSEPRVSAYPYGSDLGPEFNVNASTGTGELATEARLLREHRGRLEVRMQQLEDHNKQLEQKMQRLRQYLVSGGASNTGTLPSTNKVATELLLFDRANAETKSSLRQRSASGGLGGQFNIPDEKSFTGSGSVGQLVGTGTSELKQGGTRTPMDPAYTPYSNARQVPTNTLAEYYQVPTDNYPPTGSQLSQSSSIQSRSHQTAIR